MEIPHKDIKTQDSSTNPLLTNSEPSQPESREDVQKTEATSATADEVIIKEDKSNVSVKVQSPSDAVEQKNSASQEFSITKKEAIESDSTNLEAGLKELNTPDVKLSSLDTAINKGEQQTPEPESIAEKVQKSEVSKSLGTEKVQGTSNSLGVTDVQESAFTSTDTDTDTDRDTDKETLSPPRDHVKSAMKQSPVDTDTIKASKIFQSTGGVKWSLQLPKTSKSADAEQRPEAARGAVKRKTFFKFAKGSINKDNKQRCFLSDNKVSEQRSTFSKRSDNVKGEAKAAHQPVSDIVDAVHRLISYSSQQDDEEDFEPIPPEFTSLQMMKTTDHLFKILVIGDVGTGKTSIIRRYMDNVFDVNYRSTIGVEFSLKVLKWDAFTTVRLQVWDIAGVERVGTMTRIYYKEAYGAIVVCDATRLASFHAVLKWKDDLDKKVLLPDGSPIPCILALNKYDERTKIIPDLRDAEWVDQFSRANNFAYWYYTSAKENINVYDVFTALAVKMMSLEGTVGKFSKDPEIIELPQQRKKSNCDC